MVKLETNRYWKRIINTMNDGLIVISPEGRILMVNQAFEQLTGYTFDDVSGKPCTLLKCDACELAIKSEENKTWWCALFHPDHEGMKRCRCSYMKKDGTYIPVLKNASVLRDEEGNPLGAVETLTDISELHRLDQEVTRLSRQLDTEGRFFGIIGQSHAMQNVFDVIQRVAMSDAPVIIYGESGTGKELTARAVHLAGNRKDKPYVQFSCAALNEALLESELFGHTKGAFSGAYQHRIGRFEAANEGDIFLDEIGDVPLSIQVKLLRVLETKEFERVGDHRPIKTDVRIITATNRDIEELVQQKMFREDLFFRINVIPIHLPPLRDRSEDIPLLVNHFIKNLREKTGKNISGLSRGVIDFFMNYNWPGNIRELRSTLEYAFVLADDGLIRKEHLPRKIMGLNNNLTDRFSKTNNHEPSDEKTALLKALKQSGGNQSQAARILGINRVTVWNRMKKYGIDLKKVMTTN